MLIAVMEFFQMNALVIQAPLATRTKFVVHKPEQHVLNQNVETELNAEKSVHPLNVFVQSDTQETHTLDAVTSMNALRTLAVQTQFASIHQEASIADVCQDISEIHLQCVHLYLTCVMIHCVVLVVHVMLVREVTNVKVEIVVICAMESLVDHELLAPQGNVSVLLVTLVIQTINPRAVIYVINVKSIMTAEATKFASNQEEDYVLVSTLAANSNVDQTLYVYLITTDPHVFAKMDSPVIQMISILDVNHKNATFRKNVKEIPIVVQEKCV